jgi:hypothetical protein
MSTVRTRLIRLGAVALASGATLGTVAGTAGAATTPGSSGNSGPSGVPTTLAGIKARAATDTTDRVNSLKGAIAKVNAAKGLGSSQGTLVSYLGTDISSLQQLNQTIQGDTTVQQAAQDFGTIFSDYRVYVLVLPAARIAAITDDATTTAIPRITADAAKAQAHVTPGNQAELQPLIADLNNQIGTATNAVNGLAATVLAFTPAQWNANQDLLAAAKTSLQAAAGARDKARSDLQQIVQDLKGTASAGPDAGAGSTPTTTS